MADALASNPGSITLSAASLARWFPGPHLVARLPTELAAGRCNRRHHPRRSFGNARIRSDARARADDFHYFIDEVASRASKQLPRIKDEKTNHKTINVEKNHNDSVSILSPAAREGDTRAAGDLSCTLSCGARATGPGDRFSRAELSICI